MTTKAAFGWENSHLDTTPAGEVNPGPAERLAVHQALVVGRAAILDLVSWVFDGSGGVTGTQKRPDPR